MAARKPKKTSPAQKTEEETDVPSFEESIGRLSKIVEELEDGALSLEDSLQRFEEGVRLARASQAHLDDAESRVEMLLGLDSEGEGITEEMASD